jgi:hypothetical protein
MAVGEAEDTFLSLVPISLPDFPTEQDAERAARAALAEYVDRLSERHGRPIQYEVRTKMTLL